VLRAKVKLLDRVMLTIDGAPQLNGRIETIATRISREGATMEIGGRDLAGPALSWDADPTVRLKGLQLTAALEGLQRLECPCKVRLVSDSQYLVKGLTTWAQMWERDGWRKAGGGPVLNRDLWVFLLEQTRRHEVTAEWVRGHSGHPENERCDRLATAASKALSVAVR